MSAFTTFTPANGAGVSITAVAASSVNGEFDKGKSAKAFVVTNTGTDIAYVRTYTGEDGTEAATIADYAVIGGTQVSLGKLETDDRVAVFSAGTPVIHFIKGTGF